MSGICAPTSAFQRIQKLITEPQLRKADNYLEQEAESN